MSDPLIDRGREFLRDTVRLSIDFTQTDQGRGVPPPPLQKSFPADATRIKLTKPNVWSRIGRIDLLRAIQDRHTQRTFTEDPLSLEEISCLLWTTQGVREQLNRATTLRMVPSAGARHALETYLIAINVRGLDMGVYRYLPLEHELLQEFTNPQLESQLLEAVLGQTFMVRSATVFVWTAVPYRMEWRYGAASHKMIALDAGHVGQNLYLASQTIRAGVCTVAAYHQKKMDELIRVDGQEEFVIYLASVGKVPR